MLKSRAAACARLGVRLPRHFWSGPYGPQDHNCDKKDPYGPVQGGRRRAPPKCCSISYLPFSLLILALFLHHHFRLTHSSCSHTGIRIIDGSKESTVRNSINGKIHMLHGRARRPITCSSHTHGCVNLFPNSTSRLLHSLFL